AVDEALARAFPVLAEFPLPDGSVASLRVRRLAAETGVTADALARSLAEGVRARLASVAREVDGLDVRLDYDDGLLRGQVKRLRITASAARVGEWRPGRTTSLRVRDLRVAIDDALVNPASARAGRFDPLDARRLVVERATVDAD